jgi:signal transduction histidine kinase
MPVALVLAVALAVAWTGNDALSALRHVYLAAAIAAGLRDGRRAGGLVGLLAGLVQAPLVFPLVEEEGLTGASLDGLVSLVLPVALGAAVGALAERSARRARRLAASTEIQRMLASSCGTAAQLAVAEQVRGVLGATEVAVLLPTREGSEAGAEDRDSPGPLTALIWCLDRGETVEATDLRRDHRFTGTAAPGARPIRALALPLDAGRGPIGALGVEWTGDPPAGAREAAGEMAVFLALALEHARLVERQRGFSAQLEAAVARATHRLREIDRAKSEFLSVVSHELRTPITALEGFAELLLAREVPADKARRYLGHVLDESRRLGRIVGDLLDLARIESGRPWSVRPEPLDLTEMLERNADLAGTQSSAHRIRWWVREPLPRLDADRDAVDRVVKNLLSNAIKYSPGGGEVRLSAGPVESEPGAMEILVEDEGVGIGPEAIERIFDKYVRIASPETAGIRGLGLGLPVVRALVEAHGGRVEVRSEPGRGSAFRVILPAGEHTMP